MIKAILPYTILIVSLAMFLAGGAYLGHPLFGMFSVPILIFASLTTLAFFIGVVPSIDDVQVSDSRKATGSVLITVGSLLLGVVTYYYGKELAVPAGMPAPMAGPFWVVNWAACWIAAPLLVGVGAALKSKWTFRRIIPLVLVFAAPMLMMPMLVPTSTAVTETSGTAGVPAAVVTPEAVPAPGN